ncbi:C4-dicarboxylate transporter/malic acid transport protein [Penicillium italicum]|uniref:C4-dicarboxylate transporter/malic acid transport protein n=1 Tax=Penicillium italicum TaxID=40296 RepID=A0A0A2L115_PENIT|nr:C4-dicarboxylate transporter/malic acid transport protein [Penicillium italicum]
MGTVTVLVLMTPIPFDTPLLLYLSIVFFLLSKLRFALAFIASFLRLALSPEVWNVMIQDPTNSLFLATILVGIAALIEILVFIRVSIWGEWAKRVAWASWVIDVIAAASITMPLFFILRSKVLHNPRFKILTSDQNISSLYHLVR